MNITLNIPINSTTKPNHEIAKVLRDLANAFEPGVFKPTGEYTHNITHYEPVTATEQMPSVVKNVEYTFEDITNQFKTYAGAYGREAAVKILNTFKVKKVADIKTEDYTKVMKALGA